MAHRADILRNGALFAERWGWWPMRGWLDELAALGLVRRTADGGWAATVPARAVAEPAGRVR